VDCDDSLLADDPSVLKQYTETIINPLARIPAKVIGDNAFFYRHYITEHPGTSAWALTFYCSITFVALTSIDQPIVQNAEETKKNDSA